MRQNKIIRNSRELEFAVFCIENVAVKLGVDAERVYQEFAEKSDSLSRFLFRNCKSDFASEKIQPCH